MADNEKYDDEYQFVDMDAVNPGATDNTLVDEPVPSSGGMIADKHRKVVLRNSVIVVVGLLVLVMFIYPLIHSLFSKKEQDSAITAVNNIGTTIAPASPASPAPVVASFSQANSAINPNDAITQKLSMLESSQEGMRADVASTSNQLTSINSSMNDIGTKLNELNSTLSLFASKVDDQAREIERLVSEAAAVKKARAQRLAVKKTVTPSLKYFIQAVIPGRAWLIASNGSTLTVRAGTKVSGLGVITLIDPRQGRVVTSSGQVIRFSQEDS